MSCCLLTEVQMRHSTAQTRPSYALPRGWIVLGAALGCWLLFALAWAGISTLFNFVLASI